MAQSRDLEDTAADCELITEAVRDLRLDVYAQREGGSSAGVRLSRGRKGRGALKPIDSRSSDALGDRSNLSNDNNDQAVISPMMNNVNNKQVHDSRRAGTPSKWEINDEDDDDDDNSYPNVNVSHYNSLSYSDYTEPLPSNQGLAAITNPKTVRATAEATTTVVEW